ncbi:MAG TPA: nucleotidyltransferase, partial [Gemmataceae bacterium]
MANRMIGHLDADCFYVSAERVRDPWLNGKPVGVLGNNGACVIARSYEMKAAGVRVGEPVWDAVQRCPEGVYVKRDFHWYEVLSRRMLDVVTAFSPCVEYYAIDEFFFTAEKNRHASMESLAEQMR